MIGQYSGVATLLKNQYPAMSSFHCMAHRLELSIKHAVDTVSELSDFRCFIDEVYKVYSMSSKNQSELQAIADSMSVELLKILKVFDVQWAFSSYVSVRSVLRDFPALYKHFCACADNGSGRTSKERSRYKGLANKLQKWFFVSEACMLKDGLRCLKQLSLFMQRADAHIVDAFDSIENAKLQLLALKVENGQTLGKFWANFDRDSCYKGIEISKTDTDDAKFASFRAQFFQSLHDNVAQRFPCTDVLSAARVLSKKSWPDDPLVKALYGDTDISHLCKSFNVDSALAANILWEYGTFKRNGHVGKYLQHLFDLLSALPISSADCERGFSQMNLYHTAERNRMLTLTVSELMMIGINGPPQSAWNATKYVVSWLKSGRHGALDKATGNSATANEVPKKALLFL